MKLVIMGPQGSGKGTQAELICKEVGIPHISTGDIFRENIERKTKLGKKEKRYLDKGKLVPDEIVNQMIFSRLKGEDCEKGFLLDGYPRTLEQAKELEKHVDIDKVILLAVPDEISIKRLSGRRQCRKCRSIFGVDNPPKKGGICDGCGGELYQRDDDTEEKVRVRLREYHKETEPIIGFYREKGVLLEVDGTLAIEDVFGEVKKGLGV